MSVGYKTRNRKAPEIIQADLGSFKAESLTALEVESIVQKALNFMPRKVVASAMFPPVSEQVVSQWICGTTKVSAIRQIQILKEAKMFIKQQRKEAVEVEDQIDAYLLMQFGTTRDE